MTVRSRLMALNALIGCCLIISHMTNAKQELSFATIGTLRMRSFDLELYSDKKEEEIKDIAQALSVRLNDGDKRRLVYQICARKDQEKLIEDDINLKTLVEDLDIFYGQGQNAKDTIFNRLFEGNVRTFMGEAMAAKRIANVITDKGQLRDYQECISQLVNDRDLCKKADELLDGLQKNEANILSFWQEEAPATTKFVNQLYFGKRLSFLNKNDNVLEAGTRLGTGLGVAVLGGNYVSGVVQNYALGKYLDTKMGTCSTTIKSTLCSGLELYNPLSGIKFIRQALGNKESDLKKVMDKVLRLEISEDNAKKLQIGLGVISCCSSGIAIWTLAQNAKHFVSDFIQKRDTANFLQTRLISVARYLHTLKELHDLNVASPCLAQAFHIEQVYDRLFNSKSVEVRKLVELLVTNTFVGEASFFSRIGRVLAANTLMNNVKDEFVECMQLLGDLDAAVAVAKLYTSYVDNNRATYSFAEYATYNKPYIQAVDFWNPLIDPRIVVTNSMQLGQEGSARNMILTGSNKGGKSTLLKAMMLNSLLAQTITIVPAKRYVATPFSCLATYLNLADDTAAGLSLFQAQVMRAKKLVDMIDALSPDLFAFIIIDEIFTGTGSKKASSAAYKVAKHLSESESLCFVLATHFVDELTKLEADTNGLCKNFKADADKDENNKIVFRHKLEEGFSTQNIANEILNDEFESIDFGPDKGAVA